MSIRRALGKTARTALVLFFGVSVFFLGWSISYSEPKDDDLFLTNIDFEHKVVRESAEINEVRESWLPSHWRKNFAAVMESIRFVPLEIYHSIASPGARLVYIPAGMRREEISDTFAAQLGWQERERMIFSNELSNPEKNEFEGYLAPGAYLVFPYESSVQVRQKMLDRFEEKFLSRYASSTASVININTALKIASLIEREAAGNHDMRLISGIMWNRIFGGMTLDIDATLQYAKGSRDTGWWPLVLPKDKRIESPYNTYLNKGLPPTPIANVSEASLQAALNPQKTACMFYFHDSWRRIHCSKTYKEHVDLLEQYY